MFPPAPMRRRRVVLSRYSSLAVLSSGELTASASNGVIDQLRPDGTITRLAQLTGAGAVVAGAADLLYALDYLGGRLVRVRGDGAVEPFAEGLTRPAALAVAGDGALLVAEDTGRLLRIFRGAPGATVIFRPRRSSRNRGAGPTRNTDGAGRGPCAVVVYRAPAAAGLGGPAAAAIREA